MIPTRILMLEDNASDANFLQGRLAKAQTLQVYVDDVVTLKSALMAIGSRLYDLILADLNVPDETGVDTAWALIRAAPNVPVIVMSGMEDMDIAQKAMQLGAQAFIVKSSDLKPDTLEREIRSALDRKRQDNQAKELLLEREAALRDGKDPVPPRALLDPHMACLEKGIHAIEMYLARNAPQASEGVRAILDQTAVWVSLREMRSIIEIGESRIGNGPRETAAKALRASMLDTPIRSATEADQAFAKALLDYDDKVWDS